MQGKGYLATWSDLAPEDETDWTHWITREHAIERVRIDGFLACRIFRALDTSANRYFTLYELADDSVIASKTYLDRLNAPTPWTRRIMPSICNFARGGGRVVASAGTGQGGIVAPIRLDAMPSLDAEESVTALVRLDRVVAAHLLLTDAAKTSIPTSEKGLRRSDHSFAALLMIEGLDEAAVRAALHHVRTILPADHHAAIDCALLLYRLAFILPKQSVPL